MASVPASDCRLVHKPIAQFTDQGQKLWVFEVQNGSESPWIPGYCFSEMEFLPEDFEIMNFHASQSRTSWFMETIVFTTANSE